MKKLFISLLLMGFVCASFAQQISIIEKTESNDNIAKHQKALSGWTVLKHGGLNTTCNGSIGTCTDGTYLYSATTSAKKIFKIDIATSVIVDSITFTGGPSSASSVGAYMVGLAYDGTYFYFTNGTAVLYKVDITTGTCTSMNFPSGTAAGGLAYAPDADNGNGGFWTADLNTGNLDLYAASNLSKLQTITMANINYEDGFFWGLTYDTITAGGPYIYGLERYPQNVIRINPSTKQATPIYYAANDYSAMENYYCYGISIVPNVTISNNTYNTLCISFMSGPTLLVYDLATVFNLDSIAASMKYTDMAAFQKINVPFTVNANVINEGTQNITSFTYNYAVDGQTYSSTINNVTIKDAIDGKVINHPTQFTPTESGKTYNMQIWLSDLNGIEGLNSDTLTYSFKCYTNSVKRVVLHEGFTSATCSPCKTGNAKLKQVLSQLNPEDWTAIKYQMSWPGNGDPYYTSEGYTRRAYYGVSSVPYLTVDGGGEEEFGNAPSYYTVSLFNGYAEIPSFVELNATFQWNGQKKYNVSVEVNPLETYSGNYRLFVALVENQTKNNFADEYLEKYGAATFYANFDTVFYYVMKKFMTSASGDNITLTANTPVTKSYEYEFKGDYRLPNNAQDPISHASEHSVENFANIYA
ncbi:MAG: Omp28-related outer membrane protein, partial [Bacteroidales bacterium]|nr:Omp28-related outer membrane protein [Bacteroidales bacterium]